MVGTEGFEPTHDGIKTRCLTTWLRPNMRNFEPIKLQPKKEGAISKSIFYSSQPNIRLTD